MKLDISGRKITSLVTFFETWGGNPDEIVELQCAWNNLTSLEGCPQGVTHLYCAFNQLTSLKGCPAGLKVLYCNDNQLTTLKGCPEGVKQLNFQGNRITSFEGCPAGVTELYCAFNRISSFEGCPKNLAEFFTTYKGNPDEITELRCYHNQLTTLQGCPPSVQKLLYYDNPLTPEWKELSFSEIREKLAIKSLAKGIQIVNRVLLEHRVRRFCDNLLEKWYAPDERGIAPYAVWSYRKFVEECAV